MATLGRAEAGQFNVNSESPRPLAFVHALNRSAPLLLLPLRDVNCGSQLLRCWCVPSCGASSVARPDAPAPPPPAVAATETVTFDKAAAEEYVQKKQIHKLMGGLMQTLVDNKPADPIDFLVKTLEKMEEAEAARPTGPSAVSDPEAALEPEPEPEQPAA